MSTTKAHAFRQEQARTAKPPKAKRPPRKRRDIGVDTSLVGISATDRKRVRGPDARTHAGNRGGSVLEPPATPGAKPSRKSTRKSVDHVKQSTNLQLKASRATAAPSARAARAATTTRKARVQSKPAPRAKASTKR